MGWFSEVVASISPSDWSQTALGSAEIEPPVMGGLRAFLIGDVAIAARVVERVYQLRVPEKPIYPQITLRRIDEIRGSHLRGVNGLAKARVQIDCWARGVSDATTLGGMCARRLMGFSGFWTTTDSPPQSIRVTVLPEMEHDNFEEELDGGLCRHSADYFLYHRLLST